MATRAIVNFEREYMVNGEVQVERESFYKHWDGYLTGLGLELVDLVRNTAIDRYLTKRLTREFEPIAFDEDREAGHMWEEYVYHIVYSEKDKEIWIQYQEVRYDYESWKHSFWPLRDMFRWKFEVWGYGQSNSSAYTTYLFVHEG